MAEIQKQGANRVAEKPGGDYNPRSIRIGQLLAQAIRTDLEGRNPRGGQGFD